MNKADKRYDDLMGGTISQNEIDGIMEHYLHGDVPKGPFLAEGKDCVIKDKDGNEYIDCQAQAWALNSGHCVEEINKAIIRQLGILAHARPIHDTFPRVRLIEKLTEIAPGDLTQVGLSLSGSTASESAFKLAMINRPDALNLITLYGAWHGNSITTIAASWTPTQTRGVDQYGFGLRFKPFMNNFLRVPNPYCYRCHFGEKYPKCNMTCAKVLELTISKAASGPVAAVYLEPLQGVGGQVPAPKEYLQEVSSICDKYGVLMMYDEVQTAFGRMGTMFAAEYYGVMPDIIASAKALGNGWPVGVVFASKKLKGFDPVGEDAYTNMNNAVIHTAALANLNFIIENKLCQNAAKMGEYFTGKLKEMQKVYPQIGDIRGPGLHIGIELVKDPVSKEPADDETLKLYNEAAKNGVFFGLAGAIKNVIKIKPPLTVNIELADKILAVFEKALKAAFKK